MKETDTTKRSPGRPRGFDRQAALEVAMKTFWAHGYETTSVADLSRAMGINAPAIYSAFGDKRKLFLEAMRLYRGDDAEQEAAIRDAKDARAAAGMIMENAIRTYTGKNTPKGCMVGTGLATGSEAAADVRAEGTAMRAALEARLRARIEADITAGVLPAGTDAETLAALVSCTVQGFSTLARDGAAADKLRAIAELTLQRWPAQAPDAS